MPGLAGLVAGDCRRALAAIAIVLLATTPGWADSMTLVTSQTAQGANDSVNWSQLGSNGKVLGANFNAVSAAGTNVAVSLGGANSLVSVVCPASSCSWSGAGMPSGDSLIWTSNGNNGGNGPITLTFSRGQAGVGALVQADGPSQFTATIQAFNGLSALGSFSETSDSKGTAIYLGVRDQTASNITSVIISLTTAQGSTSDFAIDKLILGSTLGSPPPAPTITPTAVPTRTPTRTATPNPTPTAIPPNSGQITFVGAGPLADYNTAITTITVGLPSGVKSGDTLVAQILVADGTGSVVPTAPSGWISIRHDAVNNGNKETSWLFYKVAGASEPASYGWKISSNWAAGVMGAWRGGSSSPLDNASGSTAAGFSPISVSAPSLAPFYSNEMQVYFYGAQAFAGPSIALSGSLTQRFNVKSSKEGFTLAFGDKAAGSANNPSPTYPASASISGSTVLTGQAILLVPGGQSGTPAPPPPTPIPTVVGTPVPTPVPTRTATPIATPTAAPAANIAFVGAGALADYSAAVTTVTVGVPSGVHSGDVLLAQILIADGSAVVVPTAPTGWTNIRRDAVTNGNKLTSWLYYKVAGASEPASYGWRISSNWAAGVMGAWRNVSSTPIDQNSGATAAGVSPILGAAPSLVASRSNELQVFFYGAQSFSAPTISQPGAISQRLNLRSSKEGFTLAFGDLPAPFGIASPSYTAVASTSVASGTSVMTAQAVLLKPGP